MAQSPNDRCVLLGSGFREPERLHGALVGSGVLASHGLSSRCDRSRSLCAPLSRWPCLPGSLADSRGLCPACAGTWALCVTLCLRCLWGCESSPELWDRPCTWREEEGLLVQFAFLSFLLNTQNMAQAMRAHTHTHAHARACTIAHNRTRMHMHAHAQQASSP